MILAVIFKHRAYAFESEHFAFMGLNLGHFLHHACFGFSMPCPA